jgi:hypothetical protein
MMALALAACGRAEAVPAPPLQPPAAWQPLPELAAAVADAAKGDGVTVDGSAAWGERAMGCYAAWLQIRGKAAAPDTIAQQVIAGLPANTTTRDVVQPAAGADRGVLSLAFEHGGYHGKLRAQLAKDGTTSALACFWNEREPAACDAGCTALIGSMQ